MYDLAVILEKELTITCYIIWYYSDLSIYRGSYI